MSTGIARPFAIAADLLVLDSEGAYEILGGVIVEKAAPSGEHGTAQSAVNAQVWSSFDCRPGGPGGPGGWWSCEVAACCTNTRYPGTGRWTRQWAWPRCCAGPQRATSSRRPLALLDNDSLDRCL